jgi:Family of unknown function (DUF6152)
MKRTLSLLITLLLSIPVFAHHSYAQFDSTKTLSYAGVVKEFQWTNPHIWIELMVTDDKGKEVQWSMEGEAPGVLKKRGWKINQLNEGDKITISFHPRRDGTTEGSVVDVTLPDGKVLLQRAPIAN